MSSNARLDQRQLERHLWQAANLLRGKIDSSDFKHYIFGLLFYKRLSDVWEEEAEGQGTHRFQIPEGVLWPSVCGASERIGDRLDEAFRVIEHSNPRLRGLFQGVLFGNRERFPDSTLHLLLRHFEKLRLRNADVEPDMLGNAYEYLIARFADDAGKKGGEFYTPKQVARLLVECLQPDEGATIYDPACGSGGMLLEAVQHLRRSSHDPSTLRLHGQEMNLNTWAICRMNLFLHNIDDAQVVRGDTLREPAHTVDGQLRRFDCVLANPPFSLKGWGREVWQAGDPWGRDVYGCPPAQYGDLAFVQHMVASLAPAGRLAVIVPHGVLFRGHAEGHIRRGLVEADLIEAVIGLATNLFYGTGIPACVLLMRRDKESSRRGRVLFVEGSAEMARGKSQNYLSDENVTRLARAYHRYTDEPGFARVVEMQEIADQGFDLGISRYIRSPTSEKEADPRQLLGRVQALAAQLEEHDTALWRQLASLGYPELLEDGLSRDDPDGVS